MTEREYHDYLVQLTMDAYDAMPSVFGSPIKLDMDRDAFEERARESLAPAAAAFASCSRRGD